MRSDGAEICLYVNIELVAAQAAKRLEVELKLISLKTWGETIVDFKSAVGQTIKILLVRQA